METDGEAGKTGPGKVYRYVEYDYPQAEAFAEDAEIKPVCNEMELHPHFQQPEPSNL